MGPSARGPLLLVGESAEEDLGIERRDERVDLLGQAQKTDRTEIVSGSGEATSHGQQVPLAKDGHADT